MDNLADAEIAVKALLVAMGVDEDEHIADTPARVARAWRDSPLAVRGPYRRRQRRFGGSGCDNPVCVPVGAPGCEFTLRALYGDGLGVGAYDANGRQQQAEFALPVVICPLLRWPRRILRSDRRVFAAAVVLLVLRDIRHVVIRRRGVGTSWRTHAAEQVSAAPARASSATRSCLDGGTGWLLVEITGQPALKDIADEVTAKIQVVIESLSTGPARPKV